MGHNAADGTAGTGAEDNCASAADPLRIRVSAGTCEFWPGGSIDSGECDFTPLAYLTKAQEVARCRMMPSEMWEEM